MKRREFITLLGRAVATTPWPFAVAAQLPDGMRRIGVLMGIAEDDSEAQPRIAAFKEKLQQLGWAEGRTVHIDYRWAAGDADRIPHLVKELIALRPHVVLTHTTRPTAAMQLETRTIPIVFVSVSDPIGEGLVASFARPGANLTGFTNIESSIAGKWPEFLKEIAPNLARAAFLFNPDTAPGRGAYFLRPFEVAAPAYGLETIALPVRDTTQIDSALASLVDQRSAGFVVMPDVFSGTHHKLIVALAARYRLPAMYPYRYFANEGGLIAYGVDIVDLFRRAAVYIDRIFGGTAAADLPVQQPTKFELVLNLKTAKKLGLTVPPSLLARADVVIE
jgi:putative tryptophan/tyrosine transport system substrate-binding protein